MKSIGLIFKNSVLRSRMILLLAIAGAIVLCFLYQNSRQSGGGTDTIVDKIPVGVLDGDAGGFFANMLSYMENQLQMEVILAETYEELADLLLDAKISVIVEIPAGLEGELLQGGAPQLVMTHLQDYANRAFTQNYLEIYMNRAALLAESANGDRETFHTLLARADEQTPRVTPRQAQGPGAEEQKDRDSVIFIIGFYLMFAFVFTMFMGMLILEDKDCGTFRRVQCSPVRPSHYILGQALCGFLISFLLVGIFLLYLKASGSRSGIPGWLLVFCCFLYVLFSVGFSLLLAFLTKSRLVMMTVTVGFATITNILGGAWFPLADSIGNIRKLSLLTPQYWIMETLRGVQADAGYDCRTALFVLVLLTLFVYLVAAVVYNRREA